MLRCCVAHEKPPFLPLLRHITWYLLVLWNVADAIFVGMNVWCNPKPTRPTTHPQSLIAELRSKHIHNHIYFVSSFCSRNLMRNKHTHTQRKLTQIHICKTLKNIRTSDSKKINEYFVFPFHRSHRSRTRVHISHESERFKNGNGNGRHSTVCVHCARYLISIYDSTSETTATTTVDARNDSNGFLVTHLFIFGELLLLFLVHISGCVMSVPMRYA